MGAFSTYFMCPAAIFADNSTNCGTASRQARQAATETRPKPHGKGVSGMHDNVERFLKTKFYLY